jgi:hypothetical protein
MKALATVIDLDKRTLAFEAVADAVCNTSYSNWRRLRSARNAIGSKRGMGEKTMTQSNELSIQLTKIAAQARLISLAATGLQHVRGIGDGDVQGIIDLANRIESELNEIADEVHPGEPEALPG